MKKLLGVSLIGVMLLFFLSAPSSSEEKFYSAHQEQEAIFGKAFLEKEKRGEIEPSKIAIPTVEYEGPQTENRMKNEDYVFFGYHPYWADGEEDQYRYDLITHLAYFQVGINDNGTISDSLGWKTRSGFLNIKSYCQQFDVKLVLCAIKFSGLSTFLNDTTAQSTAIAGLLNEVKTAGIGGINIDFEFVSSTDASKFTTFMRNLATAFRADDPNYHISIAAYATPSSGLEELELSEICDHLFMMNYNFHYSGGNPGPVSTLESSSVWGSASTLDTIRDHIRAGIDPKKLIAGFAWYGMDWPCDSPDPGAAQTANASTYFYQDFLTVRWPTYGQIWHWPSDGPYYVRDLGGGAYRQGWCEDHVAWKRRCEMVKRTGIAGVGCWALGYCSTGTAMYPLLWQGLQESFLEGPDYIVDDFEIWDANWRDPNYSGSTTGDTDSDSTFSRSSAQAHGTGSSYSARLYYDFESATGFIREYYSSASDEGRAYFSPNSVLSVWIYGNNSNNQFRFCLRDGDGELEASDYTTINWTGWQKVEWDLGNDNINGFAGGDGVLDGFAFRLDSFQLNYPGGANNTGTIYFDDFAYTPGEEIVTVGASGADFTDIQSAIDSFNSANEEPNVVELIDSSYTLSSQLVLRNPNNATGTLVLRAAPGVDPVIVCPAGDVSISAGLDGDVEFGSDDQTITLIPSTSGGPGDNNTYAFRADEGATKINCVLKNILIAPNNGSNAAASDGKSAPNPSVHTQFGGGIQLYSGPGYTYYNNIWLSDVTVTGTGGGTGGTSDGFENYGDGDIGAWIGPGCRFSYNGGNGVYGNTKAIQFLGTRDNPVRIHNNGVDGIQLAASSLIYEISHVEVVQNGGYGLNVNSTSDSSDFVAYRSCFAQNTLDNVRFNDASVLDVRFDECTFHDAGGSSDDLYISAAAVDTHVILNDCVVTGNGSTSPSDTLNISTSSTNGTIECNYTAIVLSGPDALLAPDGLYGKKASVTQNNSVHDDPSYVSENYDNGDNADYLDVNSLDYEYAGSGSSDLCGYGDFVYSAVPDWVDY